MLSLYLICLDRYIIPQWPKVTNKFQNLKLFADNGVISIWGKYIERDENHQTNKQILNTSFDVFFLQFPSNFCV